MEMQISSWLKELGYRGEALKVGNLRGLCDDERVIDVLFFMMERLRPREEARVFRTQLGRYESLEEAREASEKVMAGKLREARRIVKDCRDKREGAYLECESSAKGLRGLQEGLLEQESKWQCEAGGNVKEQRVKKRLLKATTEKVKRSVEVLQSRMVGLKELVDHARQQRGDQNTEDVPGHTDVSSRGAHSKKVMKVLRWGESADPPLFSAQIEERKDKRAGNSGLSPEVQEELGKLLREGGGRCISQGLHQAAVRSQNKLLNFASELDVVGGTCLENLGFGYAQPMIDKLRAQHLQASLRKEALLNEVAEKEAAFSRVHGEGATQRVSVPMDTEHMEIMTKLAIARGDVETIKSRINAIRDQCNARGESLSSQVQKLQAKCRKNAEISAGLDRRVEQALQQILKLKSQIQKGRENYDRYYSSKIIDQCEQAIKQAQVPIDMQTELDALGHMKLGTHILRKSHETGDAHEHADRNISGGQASRRGYMLQCLDWSLQAKHYDQFQGSDLDPTGQRKWSWLKVR